MKLFTLKGHLQIQCHFLILSIGLTYVCWSPPGSRHGQGKNNSFTLERGFKVIPGKYAFELLYKVLLRLFRKNKYTIIYLQTKEFYILQVTMQTPQRVNGKSFGIYSVVIYRNSPNRLLGLLGI